MLKTLILYILMISPAFADSFSIYLVRHAEKENASVAVDKKDPALTLCGQERAKQLATLLSNVPLSAVYSTPYNRTLSTASPTSNDQNIVLKHYSPKSLKQLAMQLKKQQQNALVVGHSNTTPQLASLLSNQKVAPLTEADYQMLYQINFTNETPTLTVLTQPLACTYKAL